jgi:hypothetical protein
MLFHGQTASIVCNASKVVPVQPQALKFAKMVKNICLPFGFYFLIICEFGANRATKIGIEAHRAALGMKSRAARRESAETENHGRSYPALP